jgi:hypothetical protein
VSGDQATVNYRTGRSIVATRLGPCPRVVTNPRGSDQVLEENGLLAREGSDLSYVSQ